MLRAVVAMLLVAVVSYAVGYLEGQDWQLKRDSAMHPKDFIRTGKLIYTDGGGDTVWFRIQEGQ